MTKFFPNMFSLEGKVAVVTGGAGLIGREICKAYAEAGALVYIAENNKENGEKLSCELSQQGFKAKVIEIDVTDEHSVDNVIKEIVEENKTIDVWVNSAYPRTKDWGNKYENVVLDSWKKNVDMHLNSYFYCSQQVSLVMKKQGGGSLINIASIYGIVGPNFNIYEGTEMTMPAAYSAIKGGIINLTRYIATYLGAHNVRANVLCPGGVFDNQNPSFVDKYNENTPMKRMAMPDEIAGPALFLASQASSFVTGQVLAVDGGWTAQ